MQKSLTSHYKYVYDGQGNIVRSIDILATKEYNYLYEDGKIMQSTESAITLDKNNMVISKVFVCAVRYYYDTEDGLTKKHIKFADGKELTENYEKTENDSQVVKFTAGGKTVISHSKNDSFGRKVFDELQLTTGFVSRQFTYLAGEVTDKHTQNNMLKSSPTTQLVSQIVLSGGRTISYEYDEEERITKVDDSVDGITEYTYDALGQLVTETKDSITTKFEYDNYGNILAKGVVDENGEISEATKITYEYGNEKWKDLLTSYNGQEIVYDEQGNPVNYLGHTLTWEKGRQLKRFVKDDGTVIDYTYNANGIRTSKTIGGIRHDYTLDGAKILRETWCNNTLVPLYDNEDSVCGIEYNGTAYYFLKNLQGDIIAITDSSGEEVARYSYDAWGVCTVTQDISNCDIANINPFRYRSYYFDRDTKLYYLQSRYYDPTVGRFLNGDDATLIISDESVFEYCYNSPINFYDNLGYKPGQLFSKSSLAALDFAKLYYNISLYIRFEISSVIYAIWKNGKIKYSYTHYIIGNPHNCRPLDGKKFIPKGAWIVGAIHTHPNGNSFSDSDKEFAKYYYIALYVVTPNKSVRVFHDTRKGFRDELVKNNVVFSSLTQPLKNELIKIYKLRWLKHIGTNCDFNCYKKRWPTW